MIIRGLANQPVSAAVLNAATGQNFVGTVTVYVKVDSNAQAIGSVGGGLASASGNGLYTYLPSAQELDGNVVNFTFTGTGAVTANIEIAPLTIQQQVALDGLTTATSRTLRDVLTMALKRINVIESYETPPADMMQDAFDRCNDWVDSIWGNDRLAMFSIARTVWTITPGKGGPSNPYTVGLGGNINITRPQYIDHVNFIDTSFPTAIERPLIPLTPDGWAYLPIKEQTAAYPVYSYYNPTYTSAQGTLNLWLVPTSGTLQGVLYAPSQIGAFATLDDTVSLPPGYNRFLRDNLAVELAAEFRENIPTDPGLLRSAAESKAQVKRINQQLYDMSMDPAVLHHSGYRSNIYVG